MNEFWSALLQNLLMAFAPVIASLVAAWLIAQIKLIWAKAKAARPDVIDTLEWAARTAVAAAEQAGAAQLIDDKKEYAMAVADAWLRAKGLDLDLDMISAAVEAAVWQEINRDKDKPGSRRLMGFVDGVGPV